MAENLRTVSIAEMIVSDAADDVLVAYGLGSCVAVCLYDPIARVGGMLHALLPVAPEGDGADRNPTRFVDRGVPLLIDSVLDLGARHNRLMAWLAGGAHVPPAPGFGHALNIGQRNVSTAEAALESAGLRVRARATGGQIGRTVKLNISNGQVTVKSPGQGEQILS